MFSGSCRSMYSLLYATAREQLEGFLCSLPIAAGQ